MTRLNTSRTWEEQRSLFAGADLGRMTFGKRAADSRGREAVDSVRGSMRDKHSPGDAQRLAGYV